MTVDVRLEDIATRVSQRGQGSPRPTNGVDLSAVIDRMAVDIETVDTSGTATGFSFSPVVARLAGLTGEAVDPFSSSPCAALLESRSSLTLELETCRRSLVDEIAAALTCFDASDRRFLLAIKRDCFNGRPLKKYLDRKNWAQLIHSFPGLAERIVDLENRLVKNDSALELLYRRERDRERRHVLELVQDPRFLRGIALGRPGLVRKFRSKAPSLIASGFSKRPAKWEQSLLRFAIRAATKLSANSTLTSYALGSIRDLPPADLCFVSAAPEEASLVRLDRAALEQLQSLLLRHPAVRARALVAWNDSLEEIGSGRFRFVRDGHWDLAPEAKEFHYAEPVRIKITLCSEFIRRVRDATQQDAIEYRALRALLGKEHGQSFDHLIEIGALILMAPWPAYEPRLERRIGHFLRRLHKDVPELHRIAVALDEFLRLESEFASAPEPVRTIDAMKKAWTRVMDAARDLVAHEPSLVTQPHFFEDVLLKSDKDSEDDPGIIQISTATAREIIGISARVLRFAELFNHRHDILHTLAAWWHEHEPGRRELPFLDLARGFAPLWRQFLQFQKDAPGTALDTFDPLRTASLEALRECRQDLLSRYDEVLSAGQSQKVLTERQLEDLVDALPDRYAPLLPGASIFVQPLDAEGTSWVLNNISQGTGRYLSRVTQTLTGALEQRFLGHLMSRSVFEVGGEEADLLEVKYPWGSLVRAHLPQTMRVLDIRGVHLDLPSERRIRLDELTVLADLESETFRVVGPHGGRVLPVQLSTWPETQVPNVLRLLLAFGPHETRSIFPHAYTQKSDDLTRCSRLTCGKLVVRRSSWTIDIRDLRQSLNTLDDQQAYVKIDSWRRRMGLPLTGFYYEHTFHGKYKPQYIDFRSPSLVALFGSSITKAPKETLYLEEALPAPSSFPIDPSVKERRGIEVLIDSLAIRTVDSNTSVDGHNLTTRAGLSERKEAHG